jgi:hypothetical protein
LPDYSLDTLLAMVAKLALVKKEANR